MTRLSESNNQVNSLNKGHLLAAHNPFRKVALTSHIQQCVTIGLIAKRPQQIRQRQSIPVHLGKAVNQPAHQHLIDHLPRIDCIVHGVIIVRNELQPIVRGVDIWVAGGQAGALQTMRQPHAVQHMHIVVSSTVQYEQLCFVQLMRFGDGRGRLVVGLILFEVLHVSLGVDAVVELHAQHAE